MDEDAQEGEKIPFNELEASDVKARVDRAAKRFRLGNDSGRVTSEDVSARVAQRRARREASRAARAGRAKVPGRVPTVVATFLVLGALALGLGASALQETNDIAARQHAMEKVSIVDDIEELQLTSDAIESGERPEVLRERLVAVRAQAEEVAVLQQGFAEIMFRGNEETLSDDGTPTQAFQDAAEHRRLLAPYFTEGSLIVEDEDVAYGPGTVDPFGPTQIDPRFPWYLRFLDQERSGVADPADYQWSVASASPSSIDSAGVVEVVWLCRESATGDILAWANAVHGEEGGGFLGLTVGTTSIGDRPITVPDPQEEFDRIRDEVARGLSPSPSPEPTAELTPEEDQ